ncbi:hypothetical protein TrLO_g13589 [Triparma laevis f. longispina]|uniref:Uncharacterized protein n=1 Tax=Triparma laevis f. longispina TaxID=1714387 RepID=A0A9W7AWK5_9STRA|nr:hypothetical protein TrLO_g13589 [Triparma laevis f. longispina]
MEDDDVTRVENEDDVSITRLEDSPSILFSPLKFDDGSLLQSPSILFARERVIVKEEEQEEEEEEEEVNHTTLASTLSLRASNRFTLKSSMEDNGLGSYYACMVANDITSFSDARSLEDADLKDPEIGMNNIQIKRFKRMMKNVQKGPMELDEAERVVVKDENTEEEDDETVEDEDETVEGGQVEKDATVEEEENESVEYEENTPFIFENSPVEDESIESDHSSIHTCNLDENTKPPPNHPLLPSNTSSNASSKASAKLNSRYKPLTLITSSSPKPKPKPSPPPPEMVPSQFFRQFPTPHTQVLHPTPSLTSYLQTLTPNVYGKGMKKPLNTKPDFISEKLTNEWLKKNESTREQEVYDLKVVFINKRSDYRYLKTLQKSRKTVIVVEEGVKVKDLEGFRVEDYKRWKLEIDLNATVDKEEGCLFSPEVL